MIDEMVCNGKRFKRVDEEFDAIDVFEKMLDGHSGRGPRIFVFLPNVVSDVATEPMHELRSISVRKGYTYVKVQPYVIEYICSMEQFFYLVSEDPYYMPGYIQIGKIEHYPLTLKLNKVFGVEGPKVFIRLPIAPYSGNAVMKEVDQSLLREGIWYVRIVGDDQMYEVTETNLYYEAVK
jgi:hypothetical protein